MNVAASVWCFDVSTTAFDVRCFDVFAAASSSAARVLERLRLLRVLTLEGLHLLRVLTL